MNDFEKMCMRLNNAKKCGKCAYGSDNEYICAYHAVKNYVQDNNYKLLKLKGEIKYADYWSFMTVLLTILSVSVCTFTLMYTVFANSTGLESNISLIYGVVLLVATLSVLLFIVVLERKFKGVAKWP